MIKVNDIFFDIQIGTTFIGFPSVFISLSGKSTAASHVKLRPDASPGINKELTIEEIIAEIAKYNCYIVVISGGEPLKQEKIHMLIADLVNKNYLVLMETDGSQSINEINSKAILLLNIKCPEENDFDKNNYENLSLLRTKDQVKFLISSSRDYNWAKELVFKHMLFEKCNILFFANEKELPTNKLCDWIITDQLPVRLGFHAKRLVGARDN